MTRRELLLLHRYRPCTDLHLLAAISRIYLISFMGTSKNRRLKNNHPFSKSPISFELCFMEFLTPINSPEVPFGPLFDPSLASGADYAL